MGSHSGVVGTGVCVSKSLFAELCIYSILIVTQQECLCVCAVCGCASVLCCVRVYACACVQVCMYACR